MKELKVNKKLRCPRCEANISTMQFITKEGMKYWCKCGEEITVLKLKQLAESLLRLLNDY
jgi:hypothetical protein